MNKIEINKRTFNILITGFIVAVIFALLMGYLNYNSSKSIEKSHKLDLENAVLKTQIEEHQKDKFEYMRTIREINQKYVKSEEDLRNNTEVYLKTIAEVKKGKQKVREIFLPYKDSTEVAVALVQFEQCKDENTIIISQNTLLKSKSAIQDSVINTLEDVITLKDKIIVNTESRVDILKKDNKRLEKRLKVSKFAIVGTTVLGIVGIILL